MNMNWLNIKYIGRAGLIIILLFFTCPSSATCKTDTVINTYKRDSLYFAVKADSIIAFHTGDSLFTIIKADTVLPVIPKAVKRTGYDNRYIASAKTGNGLSRLMLKSNMPETWDCSPSVQGGITENGINGKQIYCSDSSRNIRRKRQK